MKECNQCKETKPFEKFSKLKTSKDGYAYKCKSCILGHEPRQIPTINKQCTKCGIIKEINSFKFKDAKKLYRHSACNNCKDKERRKSPGKKLLRKKQHLRLNYKLDYTTYLQMIKTQNNKCKICNQEQQGKSLAVDHCHTTGKVRGLLCANCNTAIGLLKEDITIFNKAIEFLKF